MGRSRIILLLLALFLTPQDCKDQCKACICQWDGHEYVCVCIAPR